MSDHLTEFLQAERDAGDYVSTGVFGVDFESAMAKRALFALPRPGLWAVRAIQSLIRLGATSVAVLVSRQSLLIRAGLKAELGLEVSPAGTFRNHGEADPRFPLQAGLLAALGRGYQLELGWNEAGRRKAMLLGHGGSQLEDRAEPMTELALEILARPPKQGLLSKLFSVADFSAEIVEIHRGLFLAPVPVTLDNRLCDFASGFSKHFYPALEFRGVRATSGPRLALETTTMAELSHRDSSEPGFEPLAGDGYALLVSLGWAERPRASTVCWLQDGVWVDEEPLFTKPSCLHLTLFLPADGLAMDATGLSLRESPERTRRVKEARMWAATSLKTFPPPLSSGVDPAHLDREVSYRLKEAMRACSLGPLKIREFEDAIVSHLAKYAEERGRYAKLSGTGAYLVKQYQSQDQKDKEESLSRWGKFLSYCPPTEDTNLHLRYRKEEKIEPPRLKSFFGEIYVEFPKSAQLADLRALSDELRRKGEVSPDRSGGPCA